MVTLVNNTHFIRILSRAFLLFVIVEHNLAADEYSGPVFKGAEPLEIVSPRYPSAEAARGGEGWVLLSYVVNDKGETVDPIIEDSTGPRIFEKTALKALRKSIYTPATLDGKPVQQCYTKRKYTFQLDGGTKGARQTFVFKYKKARKAILKDDLQTAQQLISELQEKGKRNLYEESFFWILKSAYHEAKGNHHARMQSLRRALAYENGYLPQDLFNSSAVRLFQLEAHYGEYAEAMESYQMLKDSPKSENGLELIQDVADKIVKLAESDQPFRVNGEIVEERWSRGLLKRNFSLIDVNGKLDSVDIRCERKRRKFEFSADKSWKIPASWGACTLYVEGDNGTTFGLAQSNS